MKQIDKELVELTKSYKRWRCRQLCVNIWATFFLSTLITTIPPLVVLLGTHHWDLLELKLITSTIVEKYRPQELSRLRLELDALRTEVDAISHSILSRLSNASNATRVPLQELDYDHLDCLLDPRLAFAAASGRPLGWRPPDADATRSEALELLVAALRTRPELATDARVLVRLAAARYFEAMRVFAGAPRARSAVLSQLRIANQTIHRASADASPEYTRNRTVMALYYKLCALFLCSFHTVFFPLRTNAINTLVVPLFSHIN